MIGDNGFIINERMRRIEPVRRKYTNGQISKRFDVWVAPGRCYTLDESQIHATADEATGALIAALEKRRKKAEESLDKLKAEIGILRDVHSQLQSFKYEPTNDGRRREKRQ